MATGTLELPIVAAHPVPGAVPAIKVNAGTASYKRYYEYSGTVDNKLQWQFPGPISFASGMKCWVLCTMKSATSGTVRWIGRFSAVTPANADGAGAAGDSQDADTKTFDTDNAQTSATVPGTAGHPFWVVITCSNIQSMAGRDDVQFELYRDWNNAGDTITTECEVRLVMLEWTTT